MKRNTNLDLKMHCWACHISVLYERGAIVRDAVFYFSNDVLAVMHGYANSGSFEGFEVVDLKTGKMATWEDKKHLFGVGLNNLHQSVNRELVA